MKAFIALVHREFLEHRGAFLIGPLILVALLFGPAIFAFTFGRIDANFSGAVFSAAPMRAYALGFLALCVGWCLYLLGTLFFYCADGFSADRRNNAMLFWKSMPVSDFKILLAKLTATVTIFPGLIYAVALLSGALFYAVALTTAAFSGGDVGALLGNVVIVYGNVAASLLLVLALGLLWYLPFMALVGAMGTVVGRWAIPLSLLLPAIVSAIEWVTLGGWHPFKTKTWDYMTYRADFPLTEGYGESWMIGGEPFDFRSFATDLILRMDWLQIGIGIVFAILAIYLASEYRRRVNDN
jgi:ABC-2 type transport system permease protein